MSGLRVTLLLLMGIGLQACAPMPPAQPPPPKPMPVVYERSSVAWWAEVRAVQALPKAHQAAELKARQQALKDEPSDLNRVRLLLLEALGSSAVRNESHALTLLGELGSDEEVDPGLASLAALLKQQLKEKQRVQALLATERAQAAEHQERVKQLEEQLEALTSIEQSIQEREKQIRE